MFTVVIPFYNSSNTIRNSIKSIQNQTFKKFEVIFVDDGSVDESLSIIEREKFDVPVTILKQDNKGQGAARNFGIKNASFSYISFLDADDVWYPERLSVLNDLIICHNYDVICHDEDIYENGRKISIHKCGPHQSFKDLFFLRNCLSPSATIVKKDLIIEAGMFDESENLRGVEDYDLWLRLALINAKFKYCNTVLGQYCLHENNEIKKSDFYLRSIFLHKKFEKIIERDFKDEYQLKLIRRLIKVYFNAVRSLLKQKRFIRSIIYTYYTFEQTSKYLFKLIVR